jgi:GT2 family glycosyltransferase
MSGTATERGGGAGVSDLGLVAIGRNEGARLERCLDSIPRAVAQAVYVDSGSEDQSVAAARARGVEVVELDMAIPFTAARARNAGWRRLLALRPEISMVLFVDGDCEIVDGFLEAAVERMRSSPEVVAVCGWRREREPERSAYNTLCDVEWRFAPLGETRAFGGDVLIRAAALQAVGGYDDRVIAAEDDELGVRLRAHGGKIVRIDRVSTIHDAAMTRLPQWWKRATRCGHAYGQVSDMHGAPPERYFVREARRSCLWGLAIPATATAMALPTLGFSLSMFGAYPLQAWRTFRDARKRGFTPRESAYWAVSCTASKVPEALGVLKYRLDKLRHRSPTIIEYKDGKS